MKKVYESPVLDIVNMESANDTMLNLSTGATPASGKKGIAQTTTFSTLG
jgi:hypothetical protein